MSQPAMPKLTRAMCVLWPAFLVAGVLEMLVFSLVDPSELHTFGGQSLDWPATMVYSVGFLVFWAMISVAGALTQMLTSQTQPEDGLSQSYRT
jgi:hypothetical protein